MENSDKGESDPINPLPADQRQMATLYDLSIGLQMLWDAHQEQVKKMNSQIEDLKKLIRENKEQVQFIY